jgi:hypothetical protein
MSGTPRTSKTSTHPHQGLNVEQQIEAQAEIDHPDVTLTPGERRDVAKVVAAKRALKKLPPTHATPAESEAKIRHKRTLHRHGVEVNESLGEPMAKATIEHADHHAPPGIDVGEIADALKALRIPNLGRMADSLAPPPAHRRKR